MKNFNRLTEIFILLLFFSISSVLHAQTKTSDNLFTIPAGTRIRVKMDNEINSKVSSVNDTFTVTIASPVLVRDVQTLASGYVIEGKILSVKPAASGKNGSFVVNFETLRLSSNSKRNIDASLVNEIIPSKVSPIFHTLAIVGGTALGAIFGSFSGKSSGTLIGAGIGAGAGTATIFLKKGKEVRIKTNEEFEIRLNKDVILPAEDY